MDIVGVGLKFRGWFRMYVYCTSWIYLGLRSKQSRKQQRCRTEEKQRRKDAEKQRSTEAGEENQKSKKHTVEAQQWRSRKATEPGNRNPKPIPNT